jgi:hypothetical protein
MFCDDEYVCLSHCWGDRKPFTLNSETQFALAEGINMMALPKTFQDAILVTRRLQIQYLWIDSLYEISVWNYIPSAYLYRCILQDDETDWASESRKMGDIYAHAACTIAATAAKDSSGGLFFDRCPESMRPLHVDFDFNPVAPWLEGKDAGFPLVGTYLCDVVHLAERCIEKAPLNQRAWVSQERQLSRRLLHFTSTQLFWECYECKASETYPNGLPDWAQTFWLADATVLKERLRNITNQDTDDSSTCSSSDISAQGLDYDTYYAWSIYRHQYSSFALTYNTDKLVAIQGIANLVSRATGDQFVAGLWQSRIIEELCWTKDEPMDRPTVETTKWIAPTWSWASSKTAIFVSTLTKFHGRHPSLRIEAQLTKHDIEAKPSGELKEASIKIKCKLFHAIFTPTAALSPPGQNNQQLFELVDKEGNILKFHGRYRSGNEEVCVNMDEHMSEITSPQCGYIAIMQRCLHDEDTKMAGIIEDSESKEGKEDVNSDEGDEGSNSAEGDKGYNSEGEDESFNSEGEDNGLNSEEEDPHEFKTDCLEALFLRMRNEAGERFERIGLVEFHGFSAVNQVLEAHNKAEDMVITLV